MAVTSCEPKVGGRSATVDEAFVRRYAIDYTIESDSETDTQKDILDSGLVPQQNEQLPEDTAARVVDRDLKQRDGSLTVWDLTVAWSTAVENNDDQPENPNSPYDPDDPLTFPTEIQGATTIYSIAAKKGYLLDANGIPTPGDKTAITNSANDDFDPPPEVDAARSQFSFTKNYAEIQPFVKTHVNSRNLGPFTYVGLQFAAEECKISAITFTRQEEHKKKDGTVIRYYPITVTFETDPRGQSWNISEPDIGYHYLDGATKKRILVNDEPVSAPVALDGSGGILPPTDDLVFRNYEYYDNRDWTVLNIPP